MNALEEWVRELMRHSGMHHSLPPPPLDAPVESPAPLPEPAPPEGSPS